jgi:hypothetical protein
MEARKLSPQPDPYQLSLRIRHPSIDPAEISSALGITAEHSFRAGEPRRSRSGLAPAALHCESYWLASLQPSAFLPDMFASGRWQAESVKEHMKADVTQRLGWGLQLCAMQFRGPYAKLLQRIRSEGGEVSLLVALCALTVSSFSITPALAQIFAELGITIEFVLTND